MPKATFDKSDAVKEGYFTCHQKVLEAHVARWTLRADVDFVGPYLAAAILPFG